MTTTVPAGSLRPVRTGTVAAGGVDVTLADRDRTRPFLLLHGEDGTAGMTGFADLLAERTHARVLLPTHPGFDGTSRPDALGSVRDLAAAYGALLEELDLSDVTVLGTSFGGWVALEVALLDNPRVSGVVVVDALGLVVEGQSQPDLSALSPEDGAPAADLAALRAYAGSSLADPTLQERLSDLDLPVQIIWGENDTVVDAAHGTALDETLPLSKLTVLPRTGHMPQLEKPEELLGALLDLGR